MIFKNCAPFTNCISRLNNTEVDDTHDSDNSSETYGILWQSCRDEPALANHNKIVDFTETNFITNSFKINR